MIKSRRLSAESFVHPALASRDAHWSERGTWDAAWIAPEIQVEGVFAYRLRFETLSTRRVILHVSADERFELLLDGNLLDTGPGPSDLAAWAFVTVEVDLTAGVHHLAARVWRLAARAPYSTMSAGRLGFILQSEGISPPLHTGHAQWEVAPLAGIRFSESRSVLAAGWNSHVDGGEYPTGWDVGARWEGFARPAALERGRSAHGANEYPVMTRLLVPTGLPAQQRDTRGFGTVRSVRFLERPADADESVLDALTDLIERERGATVAPGIAVELICDLEDYVCAYTRATTAGGDGARVEVWWQESLYEITGAKGDRGIVQGKEFPDGERGPTPVGHTFRCGPCEATFSTLWWNAGRFVRIVVDTTCASEPLRISAFSLLTTRYPYSDRAVVQAADPDLAWVVDACTRTFHNCSHESMMDCPFYEQLQYVGDSRIQALLAYATSDDDRLARSAIDSFDRSRSLPTGLTASRYPSRVRQEIPGFSLWWVAMVHDFALWRGDRAFVRSMLPGVRSVLEVFSAHTSEEGLLQPPPGWQFVDWVDGWIDGVPPGAQPGHPYAHLQLQYALVLRMASQLESWMGEPHLADVYDTRRRLVLDAAKASFWDDRARMYSDDLAHTAWSQHAQVLAVLSGAPDGALALSEAMSRGDVASTSLYFAFYLIDALGEIGDYRGLRTELDRWIALRETGLLTTPEEPEPSRSDCHAWSAHPIIHLMTRAVGVCPAAPGWSEVFIGEPVPGIGDLQVSLPTPRGVLEVELVAGSVTYRWPEGVRIVSKDLPS